MYCVSDDHVTVMDDIVSITIYKYYNINVLLKDVWTILSALNISITKIINN